MARSRTALSLCTATHSGLMACLGVRPADRAQHRRYSSRNSLQSAGMSADLTRSTGISSIVKGWEDTARAAPQETLVSASPSGILRLRPSG